MWSYKKSGASRVLRNQKHSLTYKHYDLTSSKIQNFCQNTQIIILKVPNVFWSHFHGYVYEVIHFFFSRFECNLKVNTTLQFEGRRTTCYYF